VGIFISFEGIEGAGKSTQIRYLKNYLFQIGHNPLETFEPGCSELGKHLREVLLSVKSKEPLQPLTELFLFSADRVQHVERYLRPYLRMGGTVICDRYVDSTVAYQGYGRGLNLTVIQQFNQIATGGLVPDLTFWLDVDVETGLMRTRKVGELDRIAQEKLEFFDRVCEGYRDLWQAYEERIVRINANQSETEMAREIRVAVDRYLNSDCYLHAQNSKEPISTEQAEQELVQTLEQRLGGV
jgi:dTMP kinase